MPGLQKLAFAGKNFDDSQRTLEQCVRRAACGGAAAQRRQRSATQSGSAACSAAARAADAPPRPARRSYGVRYWHAKFPHWPITIRRH
jgi:hypothetical protein